MRDAQRDVLMTRQGLDRLILFGAGGLGRRTLKGLRLEGIEPWGFADNNPDLWGTAVDGLTVYEPAEAARRFGREAVFVVTIWSRGQKHMDAVFSQLLKLGCLRIVSFLTIYWIYPERFLPYCTLDLPERFLAERDSMREGLNVWSDQGSREEYINQLRWRFAGDWQAVSHATADKEYFPAGLFQLIPEEVFVDCGAYDGDTVRTFLNESGERFARILALEPDPANFAKLRQYYRGLAEGVRERIDIFPYAVGDKRSKVAFAATGDTSSSIAETGSTEVEMVPLDELLTIHRPTYIKMDIEGAEPMALEGLHSVVSSHRPVLAICVYHKMGDLWRIPLKILEMWPGYHLFLRPHLAEGWELVCYAVPPERCLV